MGAVTSTILAAGALGMQAYGSYKEGKDAKAAANFNAAVYKQQAEAIEVTKSMTKAQYDRAIKKLKSGTVVGVAASGFDLSGSALDVLNDSLTQAELDKQTEIYNLDVQKSRALSGASDYITQGNRAYQSGLVGAGTSLLVGGNDFYQKSISKGKTTTVPKGK